MTDLTFASYLQGPLGEAIEATDDMGRLEPASFAPSLTLTGPSGEPVPPVEGPSMRLLGPGHVAGCAGGSVIRTDPPAGAVDVTPNYMAIAEVVPPELPWVLTPAKAAAGRLRPWLVLVVLEEAKAPMAFDSTPPTVEADVAELPDLRDSWGWAHVQRVIDGGTLPGGARAQAAAVARLVCPRRLAAGVAYRACLVPAFGSGVAAGLGDPRAGELPHDLAWKVEEGGRVRLPVYHEWTFTTGEGGDFEELVTRLEPADPDALRVSSVRPVDVREPWPGEELSTSAQLLGVQGALVPFEAPRPPQPAASQEVQAAFDERMRKQLDAPAKRVREAPEGGTTGALAPPLYGGRHVSQDLVGGEPAWIGQLNASVPNRIAAGLGTNYVRANQEDLMARAWEQVGAIREANRLRATVELTSEVAARVHERHIEPLLSGELLALAAPAGVRTKTSESTTLAMEARVSRMVDGVATSAFARRVRPAGKLAQRTGVSVGTTIPKALAGEATIPAGAPVIPASPAVAPAGLTEVSSVAAAAQLVTMKAMAEVAALDDAAPGGEALFVQLHGMLGEGVSASIEIGTISGVAAAIADQVGAVSELTSGVLAEMGEEPGKFGSASPFGVAILDTAIAERVSVALRPGDSHRRRLASQTSVPERFAEARQGDPVMACPDFPVPVALALLDSDPEWLIPGLGALPSNKVALLCQNAAFIESHLVGINHEMMRELLWREYPTDCRGTTFARFWPRPDGSVDIPPINTWLGSAPLGAHLAQADGLSVLLVRGDVVRRYPQMIVTAVRSGPPDENGHHRPDLSQPPQPPAFPIKIDESTIAYAFAIDNAELMEPASVQAPGWFFVFEESGYQIRFGFDEAPEPGEQVGFDEWSDATWPPADGSREGSVPVARGHAFASEVFTPPASAPPDGPSWNRDAADIARIALQRPFRVAIQADVILHPKAGEGG